MSHHIEAFIKNHTAGPYTESPREEKEGKSKKQRRRDMEADRIHLDGGTGNNQSSKAEDAGRVSLMAPLSAPGM